MVNYPGNIKKKYKKNINYSNRGIDLENLINITNQNYLDQDIAVIYKKPTPIQVVTYDYSKNRITDAFYKTQSTLDYNGVYRGYYIEFDAKNTNQNYLPLSNIADHQIKQIKMVIKHQGIAFLLIMINAECYLLDGSDLISFIETSTRKSIPYDYIKNQGINVNYNYLKGVNYLPGVDKLIKEKYEKNEKA